MSLITYLKESREELQKVTWPSRQAILRDTIAVLAISVGTALFLGLLDLAFSSGFQKLLERV